MVSDGRAADESVDSEDNTDAVGGDSEGDEDSGSDEEGGLDVEPLAASDEELSEGAET